MIPIYRLSDLEPSQILNRDIQEEEQVSQAVEQVIASVRQRGDRALLDYTRQFDGVSLENLQVTVREIDAAFDKLDPVLLETLEQAAENIRRFHQSQLRQDLMLTPQPGVVLGQRYTPIEKAGVCVPRTPTAFPSTILMNVIPAKLAGVKKLILVTPPEKDGSINPAALAAARIAGADQIFKVGGAQAVAALAYGTETIPAVDKIVGPGGIFVATAKRKVFGRVGIDMIAGPSEILVLADSASNPAWVAADLLSQAEHDVLASPVLVTDSLDLAQAVQAQIEYQLETLPRWEVAQKSVEINGKILLCRNMEEAVDAVNRIAPEHLELCVEEPFAVLGAIQNAGSIFLGRYTPEALGDYFAGPNHTLPTSGTARFSSPLGVDDFLKKSQTIYYTQQALENVTGGVAAFAREEGLEAHARSVEARRKQEEPV